MKLRPHLYSQREFRRDRIRAALHVAWSWIEPALVALVLVAGIAVCVWVLMQIPNW